jgi:hypothetical protein
MFVCFAFVSPIMNLIYLNQLVLLYECCNDTHPILYCYAGCRCAECGNAECRTVDCRYAGCRYAECRGTILERQEKLFKV